jgi:hypothetical protein
MSTVIMPAMALRMEEHRREQIDGIPLLQGTALAEQLRTNRPIQPGPKIP